MKSEQRRMWVPALAVSTVVAVAALGGGIAANADTDLPDQTAEEVLEMVAAQDDASFSGQFEASFALGLPQLPENRGQHGSTAQDSGAGPDGGAVPSQLAEAFALLSGTHEARVFADGPDRTRVQVFDGTEERNVVRNGEEVWTYDSAENTATRAVIPEDVQRNHATAGGDGASHGQVPTPEQLAEQVLAKLGPSTQVTVEQDTRVAGRDAYLLRLDPRTGDTLVKDVTVAVDAATGAALRVQVNAVGQDDPAISVGFTTFSPETPDASLFEFTPPEGAEVQELDVRDVTAPHDGVAGHDDPEPGLGTEHGSGWDAVVAIPADEVPEGFATSPLLEQYATATEAGRVLSTPLATILLTDDGRVLAGPVPLERLLDVAGAE
ncbi:LolA family protein [Microbacterium sp. A93]|uniref:LolA family protein n=1 Tax=Microbacterium sp. A93 TaxID=3450716 RepID=UPI003F424C89